MRLTDTQVDLIKRHAREVAGATVNIWLFGSRLDDSQRGGDIDLLLEFADPVVHPALLSARIAARLSRHLAGRRVDVIIDAPNLQRLPVHDVAFSTGRRLS